MLFRLSSVIKRSSIEGLAASLEAILALYSSICSGLNISILLFGTILGFVSFKTDINCDYEPYKEGLFDFIVKKKYWWIWLFIFQILNCFVFQDIGNPNYYTAFMMQLFTSISGIEKKYSIYQQIGISNTLMCAIYVLTAPLRRLLRIEKMLYNDGKIWEEVEE